MGAATGLAGVVPAFPGRGMLRRVSGAENLTGTLPGRHLLLGEVMLRLLSALFLPFVLAALATAQPSGRLDAAARKDAARLPDVTVPTPAEFFAALDKTGKKDWVALYRKPIPVTYPGRARIALNLGGLVADGFLAVEAQDGQQVKNTGKDIISMAKALGLSQDILNRGNSINDFAENNDWSALKEEMEATQNEVKAAMRERRDHDLVLLITLGTWLRAFEVGSAAVERTPSPAGAETLRQPALVRYLLNELQGLPDKMREKPLVQSLEGGLAELGGLMNLPPGTSLPADRVAKCAALAARLNAEISAKTTP